MRSIVRRKPHASRGFTLVELLVVISIIGILISLILPAIVRVREKARATECKNNFHNIGVALHNYHGTHNTFPPSVIRQVDGDPPPPSNAQFGLFRYRGHFTGFHMLLPFLEQQPLYDKYDFRQTWLSSMSDATDRRHWPLNQTVIKTLLCPSSPREYEILGTTDDSEINHGTLVVAGGDRPSSGSGKHWMAGAPSDYSFSHGADINRDVPGLNQSCGGMPKDWSEQPKETRGAFGYNSRCRFATIDDGKSNTFIMGEKVGSVLRYAGWNSSFPNMPVEFPWAMAAILYFGPTGEGGENSAWVVGPYAATHDLRLPTCPNARPGSGEPFPMNPFPRKLPFNSDERPFYSFLSPHDGGVHFLFGDGSVRFLQNSIDQRIYEALSTIDGGERISGGF